MTDLMHWMKRYLTRCLKISKEINETAEKITEEAFETLSRMKSRTDDSQDRLSHPMSYAQMAAFPPLASSSKPNLILSSTEKCVKSNDRK